MDELGTILGVWAHPDDETYLTAGLMARAVRNGSRVVCITATRGEGGSMDEEGWPPETMGEGRGAQGWVTPGSPGALLGGGRRGPRVLSAPAPPEGAEEFLPYWEPFEV